MAASGVSSVRTSGSLSTVRDGRLARPRVVFDNAAIAIDRFLPQLELARAMLIGRSTRNQDMNTLATAFQTIDAESIATVTGGLEKGDIKLPTPTEWLKDA